MKYYLDILRLHFRAAMRAIGLVIRQPNLVLELSRKSRFVTDGKHYASNYSDHHALPKSPHGFKNNELWDYFQNHREGHGIWKWEHYFDIYHRHLKKFVGQKVNILEIGIYSGGSLGMWRSYFGDKSKIYGVDLEAVCKTYENDYTSVFIGDQADRAFWASLRNQVDGIDILIDDGGHTPEQQKVTLEEMLPFLNPGGVYVCEDIHKRGNEFIAFFAQLIDELNTWNIVSRDDYVAELTEFQKSIKSIHLYPYVLVIEKHEATTGVLCSQRHGTLWQPFLDKKSDTAPAG